MVSGGSLRNTLGHGSATSRTLCTSSCNLADAATPRTLLELESPSSVGVSQAATEPELRPPGTPPLPLRPCSDHGKKFRAEALPEK